MPATASQTAYRFGPFILDCGRYELLREGHSLKLERKPMELLILLVSRDGQLVTRDEIAKRLWDTDVFVDTEHGINTAIRKIRTVLRDDPEDPRFVQTVTGMGYRFVAPVIAEPAFPETLQAADPAAVPAIASVIETELPPISAQPPNPPRRRRLRLAGAALAAIAMALALASLLAHLLHRSSPAIGSLAVLPLDNLSGDRNQDYFADGVTDELTTMLARNSTLRITSRTSAMQFKGAHRPLSEIARDLNVDAIVEGSITRTDGGAHMTIQLIRADTDTHLWAQSYDRGPDEVPTLPDDAAHDIATFLHATVASPQSARSVNPEAHDAYLHGRYLWFVSNHDGSAEYFKKAIKLQPDYALGWAGLADYYGGGAIQGWLDPRTSLPAEQDAATRAVQLDPTLPQAHTALCAAILVAQWDLLRADQECKAAIQLDPKFAEGYHLRAKLLAALGRHSEAIEQQKKATELDPFIHAFGLPYSYLLARQYEAGIVDTRQRLAAIPDDPSLHKALYLLYRCKGMKREAIVEQVRMFSLERDQVSADGIRNAFEKGGYEAALRWQISALEKKSATSYVSPVVLALLYAQLGNRKKTLALLEQGLDRHSPDLLWIQCDAAYDFLHADPRYRAIVNHIGLPPAY